jgi:hypothetical protein
MGDPTAELQDWVTAVARLLGIDGVLDTGGVVDTVLDLTADVAHGVNRPAAPVTAFLVGLAAGRAANPAAALENAVEAVSGLAAGWRT